MEFILDLLFVYIAIYTIYFFALAIRNLNDRKFLREKRYAKFEKENHMAVVIYSHNNKNELENLINQIKMQDYPINCIKVFAILDNCNDGSETVLMSNPFVNAVRFEEKTLGKDESVSLLLDQLKFDSWIDSYVFIDANRSISTDFLSTVNCALANSDVISGETLLNTENLDIIESVKAVYQKYHMNFIRQARSLFGLASQADSGVFIIKKEIIDQIGAVDFKDIDSELKYSLLLSKIGYKCTYNPNIKTSVNAECYIFRRPRLSNRLKLFVNCVRSLWTKNFVFIEHSLSLINPNFWLVFLGYVIILKHFYGFYFFVDYRFVILLFVLWIAGFGISLINANLTKKEILLLLLYPIYSIGHIFKNFPLVRKAQAKYFNKGNDDDKLAVDVVVLTGRNEVPCRLEFISDGGVCKVRFIFKNKKYTTSGHLRMIDALQELKTKLEDYGFILKICNCCSHFTSTQDGSTNMVKGVCSCDYPSPSLKEPKPTLIWNSCQKFSPAKLNSLIEEMMAKGSED